MASSEGRKTIRQLREEYGYSQFDLAVRVGVTPGAIANWESGRNDPRSSQLRKLALVFNVCMDAIWLPSYDDEKNSGQD